MEAVARYMTARMLSDKETGVAMRATSLERYVAIVTLSLSILTAARAQPSGETTAALRAGAARIE